MHNKASPADNFHANYNQTPPNNFAKHHQFLFPSHLYKRLFDTSIFPKTQITQTPEYPSTMEGHHKNNGNNSNNCGGSAPIPRNLLFSDEAAKSDDKENEEVRFDFTVSLFFIGWDWGGL